MSEQKKQSVKLYFPSQVRFTSDIGINMHTAYFRKLLIKNDIEILR